MPLRLQKHNIATHTLGQPLHKCLFTRRIRINRGATCSMRLFRLKWNDFFGVPSCFSLDKPKRKESINVFFFANYMARHYSTRLYRIFIICSPQPHIAIFTTQPCPAWWRVTLLRIHKTATHFPHILKSVISWGVYTDFDAAG